MSGWNNDLTTAPEPPQGESRGAEVLLACTDSRGRVCRVLAALVWFNLNEGRSLKWASTWDGMPLPDTMKPYAWAEAPIPPDLAEAT